MNPSNTQSMQDRFRQILCEQIESIHKALQNADPNDPHTVKLHRLLLSYMREYRQMEKHDAQKNEAKPQREPKRQTANAQTAQQEGDGFLETQLSVRQELDRMFGKQPIGNKKSRITASKNNGRVAKPA